MSPYSRRLGDRSYCIIHTSRVQLVQIGLDLENAGNGGHRPLAIASLVEAAFYYVYFTNLEKKGG